MKHYYLQILPVLTHGAAILDFQLGVPEGSTSFQDGVPTSGGVDNDTSEWNLGNSNFQQLCCTCTHGLTVVSVKVEAEM